MSSQCGLCVVCGVWCVVCGVWCVVCGVWCVACVCLCVCEREREREREREIIHELDSCHFPGPTRLHVRETESSWEQREARLD